MTLITHCITPEALDGERVEVEGEAYRHLFRARRLARGARLRLVDGRGRARWAVVETIDRRTAWLRLGDTAEPREPRYTLDLWVAALRPERAAWLVEKATELGVASVHFFRSERTPRNYGAGNLERWRRMASAAVEQCHRSRCPEISGVEPWDALVDAVAWHAGRDGHDLLLLDTDGAPATEPPTAGRAGLVVVGPEGGLEESERVALRGLGCTPLSLGERVLRVETAALVATARQILLAQPAS